MFCKNCGKQIKDDAHFCPYCGKGVGLSDKTQSKINSAYMKKKKAKWPLVLTFFVLVISVGIAMSYAGRKADNVKKNNNYQALVDEGNRYIEDGFHTIPEVRKLALTGELLEKWAEADANGIAEGYELMKKGR